MPAMAREGMLLPVRQDPIPERTNEPTLAPGSPSQRARQAGPCLSRTQLPLGTPLSLALAGLQLWVFLLEDITTEVTLLVGPR